MVDELRLGRRVVGDPLDPYIIAEIGVNHEGSLAKAKALIDLAADAGAHAAKFQTYKAATLAAKESPSYWDLEKEPTESQHELFKKYDSFGPDEYAELSGHCKDRSIDFLSTPFDLDAVDMLDPLMSYFKVASADITNLPLLRKVASKGKLVILSTGASSLAEIEFAISTLRAWGSSEVILLHCVLNYPTAEEDAQLGMIGVLKRTFPECLIGYSDHVVPDETISALEAAMLKGAVVLEKHFTNNKSLPGNDHYHAMDKADLSAFLVKAQKYRTLLSGQGKDLTIEKDSIMHARRSIVTKGEIRKGDVFSEENLVTKRPGHGISPIHWDTVIGSRARSDMSDDEILNWSEIKLS